MNLVRTVAYAAALYVSTAPALAQKDQSHHEPLQFVTRSGNKLTVGGTPFRFSGANVDWLGLSSNSYYRPDAFYPAPSEVNDALETVHEMGGTVVRSHTLGISVGCPQCIEPLRGTFNEEALRHVDFALMEAAAHHLRVIIPLVDTVSAHCGAKRDQGFPGEFYYGNICEFLSWNQESDPERFYTSSAVRDDFYRYVDYLLNRINSYTGVAYKDDPTILAWEDCNTCGVEGNRTSVMRWVEDLATHIKGVDKYHLVMDNSALQRFGVEGEYFAPANVDIIANEYYPFWDKWLAPMLKRPVVTDATHMNADADAAAKRGYVFVTCEFGWDAANWATRTSLANFLIAMQQNPNVSGSLFWNLEAHAADHGWMPVHGPAKPNVRSAEDDLFPGGDWWAFFYTGRDTRWNQASDMYARGQLLRDHAFRMAGRIPVPPSVPMQPVITATLSGLVRWRGSVGAIRYSVDHAPSSRGPWISGCDKCATDDDGQWQDPLKPTNPVWYRVVPFGSDGREGMPSVAVERQGR